MIFYDEKIKTFYLNTKSTSYVMRILPNGMLNHVYYGAGIPCDNISYYNLFRERAFSPICHIGNTVTSKDCIPQEYPTFGRGDYRRPAIEIEAAGGRRVCSLKYASHSIVKGKPKMERLPQLLADEAESETLTITLDDRVAGLSAVLYYTVFKNSDIIARRTEIVNNSGAPIRLNKAASANVDMLLKNDYDLINLNGAWGREFAIERVPLHHGITSCDSHRGATGHQQNPFIVLAEKNACEESGEVYGFALIYSSDFSMSLEKDQFNGIRVQMGINSFDFSWNLKPGETFATPEALMVYSGKGLTGMSHEFHGACRRYLGRSRTGLAKRRIVINNWEAMSYDFDAEKLKSFIKSCSGYGIDTFVLDDGWFGKRNSEDSSLGDWEVNSDKLPNGLSEIIETCRSNGLEFGLWIEPEMVSENSRLFSLHPDWCIHVKNRRTVKSRGQYVLDFSRPEVVDYIYGKISDILRHNDISYVKWDMNRNITDNGSDALPNGCQGEHSHRYILGVYDLMERLTGEFSDVLFEGCSGGGGRFDFGILYYMPQIWTSDDSDAIERTCIQYGSSLVYPPSAMSAHVSACPNHQTGRITPFKTRGDVAQLCNFGYELDISKLGEDEKELIKRQVAVHKSIEDLVETGDYYRLINPFEENTFAWEAVSRDKRKAYAVFVRKLSVPNDPGYFLRLRGLDGSLKYTVKELGITVSGAALMNAGIPILMKDMDYSSVTYTVEAAD